MAMLKFQSAPVIADGRTRHRDGQRGRDNGFNPRPSLLTGEPFAIGNPKPQSFCFNPRPSLLTGEP